MVSRCFVFIQLEKVAALPFFRHPLSTLSIFVFYSMILTALPQNFIDKVIIFGLLKNAQMQGAPAFAEAATRRQAKF